MQLMQAIDHFVSLSPFEDGISKSLEALNIPISCTFAAQLLSDIKLLQSKGSI